MKQSRQQVFETRLNSIERKKNREENLQKRISYALQYREKNESTYILRSTEIRADIKNYDNSSAKIDFVSLFDELENDFNYGLKGGLFLDKAKFIKDINANESGVYLLYDVDGLLIYVGESICLKKRVKQHLNKKGVYKIGLLYCEKKLRKALEMYVISTRLPILNSQTNPIFQDFI